MNQLSNESLNRFAEIFEGLLTKFEEVLESRSEDKRKLYECQDVIAELQAEALEADKETAEKIDFVTEKAQAFAEKILRATADEVDAPATEEVQPDLVEELEQIDSLEIPEAGQNTNEQV